MRAHLGWGVFMRFGHVDNLFFGSNDFGAAGALFWEFLAPMGVRDRFSMPKLPLKHFTTAWPLIVYAAAAFFAATCCGAAVHANTNFMF